MKLVIPKSNGITRPIIVKLLRVVKVKLLSELSNKQLERMQSYIDNHRLFRDNKLNNVYTLYKMCIYNLTIKETPDDFIIEQDSTTYANGVKITTVAKLLNYGNLSMQGFPLFTHVFNDVVDDFTTYMAACNLI